MKKLLILAICCVYFMLPCLSAAETRTVSWDRVTTYAPYMSADNVLITDELIDPNIVIFYEVYWSTSTDFTQLPSLHTITTQTISTQVSFDAITESLPRQTTIYFTARARLMTDGATSDFAPPYPWFVPAIPAPGKPTLNSAVLNR